MTKRRANDMLKALVALVSLVAVTPTAAQDVCPANQKYEGAPRRPAPNAAAFPAASPTAQPMAADRAARLDQTLAMFDQAAHPPGVAAAIVTEHGDSWSAVRGSTSEMPLLFYWASAGKAWTAIAVLQLVEEGKLKLSDTLDRWAPDFPNARLITIDQLLSHTSGLYSFQEDAGLRSRPGYKSRAEVLETARSHAPLFCPGRTWAYSNTGYVLLGLIVERLDGRPLHEALTARIVPRLDLKATRILGPGVSLEGIAPPVRSSAPGGTADDIRTPGAAGPVAASAPDMARFWFAALTGELTSRRSSRDQFAALYPMSIQPGGFYGRGVMLFEVPASDRTPADVWLGHSGGLPGARAVVAWSVTRRTVVAVALVGDGPAEGLANRLVAALTK
jgi:D-alanyl-D-alanine carboxypeptidase